MSRDARLDGAGKGRVYLGSSSIVIRSAAGNLTGSGNLPNWRGAEGV
jgi:hypothetical protein